MTKAQQEIRLTEQREAQIAYPPAYFLSIELENVLCFKTRQKLDLSDAQGFPAQWTVILGNNGVGKTTLLRSLAGMEPKPVKRLTIASGTEVIVAEPRLASIFSEGMQIFQSLETRIETHFMYGFELDSRRGGSNGQAIKSSMNMHVQWLCCMKDQKAKPSLTQP
jgi:ATPase subunit of ABC transporter with duplicated ATPase domains